MPVIKQLGSGHNGALLEATKTQAEGAGVIVTLEMRAMKNWGGTSSGAAFVQMVGVETQKYEQTEIKCTVEAGADGATHVKSTKQGFFFAGAQSVVIIASMEHKDTSNWDEWQADIENNVKSVVKKLVDSATDPKTLLDAAGAAGFIGTII